MTKRNDLTTVYQVRVPGVDPVMWSGTARRTTKGWMVTGEGFYIEADLSDTQREALLAFLTRQTQYVALHAAVLADTIELQRWAIKELGRIG